jgi:hypothetical protein
VLGLIGLLITPELYAQSTGMSLKKKKDEEVVVVKRDTILVQTIRGQIIDSETRYGLENATIVLYLDSVRYVGAYSDYLGNFRLEKIPVGRFLIRVTHVGYRKTEQSVLVSSTKETLLEISMESTHYQLSEIKIQGKSTVTNSVGGYPINLEDLNRYPGTRGESVRKISLLTGIQSADDSRNDVVIRGNSPGSVLWRLEGVNIPNPNHFNISGTAGGPVTMINDKMLGSSSFYSGAFPAEFGNTTSGIFDLYFREGDSTQHSHSAQVGTLGVEYSGEGPISQKNNSSYVVSFRRSILGVFQGMGLDIGTNAIPEYTDASFKVNLPQRNNASFSIFGLGGMSTIDILISKGKGNIYGELDRDQYFRTATGIAGINYTNPVNKNTYLSATLAVTGERIKGYSELVYPEDLRQTILECDTETNPETFPPILNYMFKESRLSGSFLLTKKLSRQGSYITAGVTSDFYFFKYADSTRIINEEDPEFCTWRTRWLSRGNSLLLQPYVQWKYSTKMIELSAGLHSQYFSLSNSLSPAEPRLGLRYHINERQKLNAGFGLHSQIQAPYLYFFRTSYDASGNPVLANKKMDFTRSFHSVIGYEHFLGPERAHTRLKAEVYYQKIYNVPIERDSISSFSLLNTGASFSRFYPNALINNGQGENYGLEVTVERSFSKGYVFLITGSLFQSKYEGSDNVRRNTDFNGNYILNMMYSKEWVLKKQHILAMGARVSTAGGRRYGPVDEEASEREKEVIYVDETRNTLQFNPYFRADFRLSYTINKKRTSHEFAFDFLNLTDRKNVLRQTYAPSYEPGKSGEVVTEYQLGFLPFFYYRIDF